MFENPGRGRQARNFTANVPKILDLKSSFEQIFSENCRWVPLLQFITFIDAQRLSCLSFMNKVDSTCFPERITPIIFALSEIDL